MSTLEQQIVATALTLPKEVRTALAEQLLASLESEPADSTAQTTANGHRFQSKPPLFWQKSRSEELNRVGDWMLANLSVIREETIDHGNPF